MRFCNRPFTSLALLAAALPALASSAQGQTLVDTRLKLANWVTGLSSPTTFTWIGPGEMLVIQKNDGRVRWVKDGVILGTALDLAVNSSSERGGLGIAADADFANNGFVYVYYSKSTTSGDTSTSGTWADNRVERYTWSGGTLGSVFGPLVAFPFDATQANGDNHDGGVIRIGPDGLLYGQTGDLNRGRFGGGDERVEQNTATSGSASVGGVFRINTDGTIPADNPFTGEADAALHLWWSYGLRNGFGMAFDPVNGTLWNTENGPNLYDEVGRVPKGANSGWLKIMGPDARDATYFENGNSAFDESDLVALQNSIYVDPALSFKTPIGITAIAFLGSKLFPDDLVNHVIVGDNNTGSLFFCEMKSSRVDFKLPSGVGDKVVDNTTERNRLLWGSGWGVVTDAQIGPDGYLYVVNLAGNRILRVRPVTDEVDPARWLPDPGLVVNGTPAGAETSDDKSYNFSDKTLTPQPDPLVVRASFKLQGATPTAATLQVETRYVRGAVPQLIEAWNVVQSRWQKLDVDAIGDVDVAKSLVLATPADYVDPATLEVKVRITALPLKPWRVPFSPTRLTMLIDLLRLDVSYP